jgi:hypothetical protein
MPPDTEEADIETGAETTADSDPIKAASDRFLASLTPEQANTPFGKGPGEELADAQDELETGTLGDRSTATGGDEAAEEEEDPDNKNLTDEDKAAGRFRDKMGRLHEADGDFAKEEKKPVPAAADTPVKPAKEAGKEAGKEGKGTPAAEAGKPITVVLPGLKDRGEEDIPIDTDDPAVAERLRRNANDGLRREAYDNAMKAVDTDKAELDDIRDALKLSPVSWIIENVTPERRVELGKALLAEHFPDLQALIEDYQGDPSKILDDRLKLRDDRDMDSKKLRTAAMRREYARGIESAVRALIPNDVDPQLADYFIEDALGDLTRAAKKGDQVTVRTVPQLLRQRLSLYKPEFDRAAPKGARSSSPSGSSSKTPQDDQDVRPVSDRAREIRDRRAGAEGSSERRRNVTATRARAAKAGVPGVGATTTVRRVIPKGATIEEATEALRKAGVSDSWKPSTS